MCCRDKRKVTPKDCSDAIASGATAVCHCHSFSAHVVFQPHYFAAVFAAAHESAFGT
jgi:hypothetical protein